MITRRRYKDLETISLQIWKLRIAIIGSNFKGAHVTLEITFGCVSISLGLNYWKVEINETGDKDT